jgi:hypothetical protein
MIEGDCILEFGFGMRKKTHETTVFPAFKVSASVMLIGALLLNVMILPSPRRLHSQSFPQFRGQLV